MFFTSKQINVFNIPGVLKYPVVTNEGLTRASKNS